MLMNGPLVTEFKCDDNFGMYSSGVMIQPDRPASYGPSGRKEDELDSLHIKFVKDRGNKFEKP